ncbi:hypothetical protein [uncultured Campylobacter sp.]
MRDYDKEPIKIIDRTVYFQEKSLFLSIVLFTLHIRLMPLLWIL